MTKNFSLRTGIPLIHPPLRGSGLDINYGVGYPSLTARPSTIGKIQRMILFYIHSFASFVRPDPGSCSTQLCKTEQHIHSPLLNLTPGTIPAPLL